MKPKDPPAFPTHSVEKEPGQAAFQVSEGGMTLRDYFAAKVMQGVLAQTSIDDRAFLAKQSAEAGRAIIAKLSYELADAMLAVRQLP